jgi:hypothetical protein
MQAMTDTLPRKKDDTRNLLAGIALFEGLTPSQLEWVAQRAHRRTSWRGGLYHLTWNRENPH